MFLVVCCVGADRWRSGRLQLAAPLVLSNKNCCQKVKHGNQISEEDCHHSLKFTDDLQAGIRLQEVLAHPNLRVVSQEELLRWHMLPAAVPCCSTVVADFDSEACFEGLSFVAGVRVAWETSFRQLFYI